MTCFYHCNSYCGRGRQHQKWCCFYFVDWRLKWRVSWPTLRKQHYKEKHMEKARSPVFMEMTLINLICTHTQFWPSPIRKFEVYGLKGWVSVEKPGRSLSMNRIFTTFCRNSLRCGNSVTHYISITITNAHKYYPISSVGIFYSFISEGSVRIIP